MAISAERFDIEGLVVIKPVLFTDERGFFMETYKKSDFAACGITEEFVQDNHSLSRAGTVRGVHYQLPPFAQGKLVRVVKGRVWDVAVDLREYSPTFKQWVGVELSDKNHVMFYLPPGFGHGFIALEDDTHFLYKCTNVYSKQHEAGIRWDDPAIGIKWPEIGEYIVSEKDRMLPLLKDAAVF